MSQENPTPEELDEIEQFQYGAYGAEPPLWWLIKSSTNRELSFNGFTKPTDRPIIPAEAVRKFLHRLGLHYYSMITTYRDGREERSCIYCGRKQ